MNEVAAVYLLDRREWKRLIGISRKGTVMGALILGALAAISQASWRAAHRKHCSACARRAEQLTAERAQRRRGLR